MELEASRKSPLALPYMVSFSPYMGEAGVPHDRLHRAYGDGLPGGVEVEG
jgi:hypothetical protein